MSSESEGRPEPRPELSPELKPEANAQAHSEPNPGPNPESHPESHPEPGQGAEQPPARLLRVGRIMHGTIAEGPDRRTALWVQGCTIRCRGCINPELFAPRGGTMMSPDQIVSGALEAGDEGITLLGGEPLDQAEALGELAAVAQAAGLGIICFTGYSYEDIASRPEAAQLMAHTDLLVDGPYDQNRPEQERTLVGSENQRFLHFSQRYAEVLPAQRAARGNRVELRIAADGTVEMAGFLTDDGVKAWAQDLGAVRRKRA